MWYGQAANKQSSVYGFCSNMQWYECWHSEGVAPQFTKPPFFPLEEKGGYLLLHHWNVNSLKSWQLIEETS